MHHACRERPTERFYKAPPLLPNGHSAAVRALVPSLHPMHPAHRATDGPIPPPERGSATAQWRQAAPVRRRRDHRLPAARRSRRGNPCTACHCRKGTDYSGLPERLCPDRSPLPIHLNRLRCGLRIDHVLQRIEILELSHVTISKRQVSGNQLSRPAIDDMLVEQLWLNQRYHLRHDISSLFKHRLQRFAREESDMGDIEHAVGAISPVPPANSSRLAMFLMFGTLASTRVFSSSQLRTRTSTRHGS